MTTGTDRMARREHSPCGPSDGRHLVFDAHFHIIDPARPVVENNGFLPPPFRAEDYARALDQASITAVGGAVVSGSFHGFDQGYLLHALRVMGTHYVGVTQIPVSASDAEILRLDAGQVRAVRFNLRRGGGESRGSLLELARRVHGLAGWHTELYATCDDVADLEPVLARLPRLVVDHMGLPSDTNERGFKALLRLVERGAYVKASGFGRFEADAAKALRLVARENPAALVLGTDLPSTRAPRPFRRQDVELILDTLGDEQGRMVLHDNGIALYRVPAQ